MREIGADESKLHLNSRPKTTTDVRIWMTFSKDANALGREERLTGDVLQINFVKGHEADKTGNTDATRVQRSGMHRNPRQLGGEQHTNLRGRRELSE